jgi:hypothetical protein
LIPVSLMQVSSAHSKRMTATGASGALKLCFQR